MWRHEYQFILDTRRKKTMTLSTKQNWHWKAYVTMARFMDRNGNGGKGRGEGDGKGRGKEEGTVGYERRVDGGQGGRMKGWRR